MPDSTVCDPLYKKGTFPQKSDCELDLLVDSVKSVIYARLVIVHHVPKLQSFKYHTRTYLRLFQSYR